MAYNKASDLAGDGTNATQGASFLFRALGGWGHIAGPAEFMLKTIIFGSSSAVCFGLVGGLTGAFLYGTAGLPFLVASSFGFVLGVTRWYRASVTQALLQIERFPALFRLHMDANFPSQRFRLRPVSYFTPDRFQTDWKRESMLVVAWLTAQQALDEIHIAEEQALIADASQEIADAKADSSRE